MRFCALFLALLMGLYGLPPFAYADEPAVSQEDLEKVNNDLSGQIEKLQDKISDLEGRLAAMPRGEAPTGFIAQAPEVPTGVARVVDGLEMSGFVDLGYSFNLDNTRLSTDGNSRLRAFERDENNFNMNAVELVLQRPTPEEGVGFRTDLYFGSDARIIGATMGTRRGVADTDAAELDVQQAYIEANLPYDLTARAGKYVTLAGSEVIETKDNWNLSRSYLFTLSIPFTHTGIRLSRPWWDDKLTTIVGINNGWDIAVDNNNFKTVELGVTASPRDNLNLSSVLYLGPERADDESDYRGINSNVIVWTPLPDSLPELRLMGNLDFSWDSDAGAKAGNEKWWGYALYAHYQATEKLSFVTRYERFSDEEGVRVPFATNDAVSVWEITLGAEYKLYTNLLSRVEYRYDESSELNFVSDASGGGSNYQNTVAAKLVYTFG